MAHCRKCGSQMSGYASVCERCGCKVTALAQPAVSFKPAYPAEYPPAQQDITFGYAGSGAMSYMQKTMPRPCSSSLPWILVGVWAVALIGTFAVLGAMADATQKGSEELSNEVDNLAVVLQMQSVRESDAGLANFINTAMRQTSGDINDRFNEQAQLMRDYINLAGKADMDKCPSDFVDIYRRNLAIYSRQADLLASHPHLPSDAELFVNSILHGASGDYTYAENEQQEVAAWAQKAKSGYQAIKEADQGSIMYTSLIPPVISDVRSHAIATACGNFATLRF